MPVEVVGILHDLPNNGKRWSLQYALFSRVAFTPTARALAEEQHVLLVDLKQLD